MQLNQKLIDAARELLNTRFPDSGGLAAAAYTAEGNFFTSVVFDPEWGMVVCAQKPAQSLKRINTMND